MGRLILISLVFICFDLNAYSQKYIINGCVSDSMNKQGIASAQIINLDNGDVVFTDDYGLFKLYVSKLPVNLKIIQLSYYPFIIQLKDYKQFLQITLSPKIFGLPEVEIKPAQPCEVLQTARFYITDYEFNNDNILLLGYFHNRIKPPWLLLLNESGDTISSLTVFGAESICKDYNNEVYLLTRKTAYKINADSLNVSLSCPIGIDEFNLINNTLVARTDEYFFLKSFVNNNKTLLYFDYHEETDKLQPFRTISDDDAISRNRWGTYFDGEEEDVIFQQLIINKPVYAPLVKINDTIFIFNYPDSKIEYYNSETEFIGETKIVYHKQKGFGEFLTTDNASGKVYCLYKNNGIAALSEVSPLRGELMNKIQIPDFVYVEEIKVHNGFAYFLYKEKNLEEYKKLYRFKI